MKRVYVAGAYSADNIVECLRNIGRGEDYSARIFNMGFAPFCPWHDKEFVIRNWNADYIVQQFYDYSIAWLEVSDCVFLVPGWRIVMEQRKRSLSLKKWASLSLKI